MKLIDLLVRELPKRGGWPDGAEAVVQDADDMEFYFYTGGPVVNTGKSWWFKDSVDSSTWIFYEGKFEVADDHDTTTITRDQYEAALAASQKVEWSGDGLPPVGCECERKFTGCSDTYWEMIKILWAGDDEILYEYIGKNFNSTKQYHSNVSSTHLFRPLRSETDKKRDAAVESINYWMPEYIPDTPNEYYHAKKIYDAIAAGKIPGVKLDD
ncbi:hypothetical protein [Citrobacter phage vB_CfrS_K1M]